MTSNDDVFFRRLKRAGLSTPVLLAFYRCVVESTLTFLSLPGTETVLMLTRRHCRGWSNLLRTFIPAGAEAEQYYEGSHPPGK